MVGACWLSEYSCDSFYFVGRYGNIKSPAIDFIDFLGFEALGFWGSHVL